MRPESASGASACGYRRPAVKPVTGAEISTTDSRGGTRTSDTRIMMARRKCRRVRAVGSRSVFTGVPALGSRVVAGSSRGVRCHLVATSCPERLMIGRWPCSPEPRDVGACGCCGTRKPARTGGRGTPRPAPRLPSIPARRVHRRRRALPAPGPARSQGRSLTRAPSRPQTITERLTGGEPLLKG